VYSEEDCLGREKRGSHLPAMTKGRKKKNVSGKDTSSAERSPKSSRRKKGRGGRSSTVNCRREEKRDRSSLERIHSLVLPKELPLMTKESEGER